MNIRDYNLKFNKMSSSWDEGLPIGNGRMGCLLYGDNPLHISVDRIDLWDSRPHPNTLDDKFNYKTLIRLAKSENREDIKERKKLFEDIYDEFSYPSKITVGRIEIYPSNSENAISAEVDIENAVSKISYPDFYAEGFVHATKQVGIFKLKGDFKLKLHIPNYISDNIANDNFKSGEGGQIIPEKGMQYPISRIAEKDGFCYYIQNTKTDFKYGLFTYTLKKNGYTYLYFTVVTSDDTDNIKNTATNLLLNISDFEYSKIKNEHSAYWKRYWKKSSICIPDKELEKTYYRSWYLFASTSRKGSYPMPLQGVWTADNDCLPPWRGDYHHDTNTQMSYQGFLKANRLKEGICFTDYLWKYRKQYKSFAESFYGVKGLIIPGVSTIDGKPMGGWAHYSLSPTMTIWAAQSFDELYLYTGSKTYLMKRAFPFFKDIADAFMGILEERNGKLYLPLSSSPEIHDDTVAAYLEPNSNFDLGLLRYLFSKTVLYCDALGQDGTKYKEALSKLDDINLINGVISLDKNELLNESHRHFSHLIALYPLHLINYDTDEHKKIYENSLEQLENLGTENWVGFSFCMAAQIYAMAENGEKAYENLFKFADGFVGENGFHLNGDFKNRGYSNYKYRPFTLESLFGFCDALQEMLLQQHRGYIHIFPAIPKEWCSKTVAFKNFRGYNGVRISAKMLNGKIKEIEFFSKKEATLKIKNSFGSECIRYENKTVYDKNGYFEVTLKKGKSKILEEKVL